MSEYEDLVKRLNEYSAQHENHGGITAEAADAIEELQGKLYLMKKTAEWLNEEIPRWISVDEALPEKYGTALVTTERGSVMVCCYYPQAKNWNTRAKVKWWMPLPQPPQEENNEL